MMNGYSLAKVQSIKEKLSGAIVMYKRLLCHLSCCFNIIFFKLSLSVFILLKLISSFFDILDA